MLYGEDWEHRPAITNDQMWFSALSATTTILETPREGRALLFTDFQMMNAFDLDLRERDRIRALCNALGLRAVVVGWGTTKEIMRYRRVSNYDDHLFIIRRTPWPLYRNHQNAKFENHCCSTNLIFKIWCPRTKTFRKNTEVYVVNRIFLFHMQEDYSLSIL